MSEEVPVEKSRSVLNVARMALGKLTRRRRAIDGSAPPVTTEIPSSPVVLHTSGHLEFATRELLLSALDGMLKSMFLDVECPAIPSWRERVILLCAHAHPAIVDVTARLELLDGTRARVHFSDRDELQAAVQGLRDTLPLNSHPIAGRAQLPIMDASLCVQFTTAPAVLALMPAAFRLGVMRVRWTGPRPPAGMVDVAIALHPLKDRAVVRGWFGGVQDGILTISLDARDDVTIRLNQWLTLVRERTTAKLKAIKGPPQ